MSWLVCIEDKVKQQAENFSQVEYQDTCKVSVFAANAVSRSRAKVSHHMTVVVEVRKSVEDEGDVVRTLLMGIAKFVLQDYLSVTQKLYFIGKEIEALSQSLC